MDVSPLGFEVGVTPLDDHLAAEIHLQTHFADLPKGICGTGTHLKRVSRRSLVMWSIWKAMR